MNAFIEVSDAELVVQLGELANSLDSAVCKNAAEAVKQGKTADVLKELITHATLFYADTENLEMVINSLVRSLRAVSAEARAPLTSLLAATLSHTGAEHTHTASLRLVALVSLFNGLDKGDKTRLDVFERVLCFAGQTGHLDAIVSTLSSVPVWIKEWQLDLAQTRTLFRLIHKTLHSSSSSSSSHSRLALDFLTRLVATYTVNTGDVAIAKAEAEDLVTLALLHESVYDVSNILALDAVKAVKQEPIVQVLEMMQSGQLEAFTHIPAALTHSLTSRGLSVERLERKVRLMCLARLFASKSSLTFVEIAHTLLIEPAAVESCVIDGIRAGLVEAKVDELNSVVVVTRATHTDFTRSHWELLLTRICEWKKNIADVHSTLDQVKLQVQRTLQSAAQSR